MAADITIFKDNRSPALTDIITVDDVPFDLTGCTVRFRMRPANSSTLEVDASATITDATAGKVKYAWAAADVDTAGVFYGWWSITLADATLQDTPEFKITIDAHAPGDGATTGILAERVRELMPVSYDALVKDNRYGERLITNRISLTQYRLFATVAAVADEGTNYDFFVQDFVSKVACLQIIPAAIEYWSDQHTTISTTGTQESVSYPDRIQALKGLQEWLIGEVRMMKPEVDAILPTKARRKTRYPKVSTTGELLTADPGKFTKPFGDPWPDNIYAPFRSESAIWPF